MDEKVKQELKQICETALFEEPMSRYTSVRIGGPAEALLYPKTVDELSAVLKFGRKNGLPVFVLGAGSNLLVRDKGLRGLVVNLSQGFNRIEVEGNDPDGGGVILFAEAGVGVPRLVDYAAEEGLSGLEAISGIPGNVGGALFMNAGTKEGDTASAVVSVTFLILDKKGEVKVTTWPKEDIGYAYRESHFPRGAVILSGRFRLTRMASELVRGKIQKHRAYRLETQPLNVPNLGSVFKNPDEKKVFAAKLIEDAGLKDVRVGGARVSPKHANWIVNEGGATAKDVLALIGLIRDKVKEKYGVLLDPEVKVVGDE